jgi:radical SAM-linked protein
MLENFYKYRLKLSKSGELKFLSHLDWQNLILKSLRRAEVKLALSQGFNPLPKVAFSPALPIFIESVCELVNFTTTKPLREDFCETFQKCTNENVRVLNFQKLPQTQTRLESLDILVQWAHYEAKVNPSFLDNKNESIFNLNSLRYNIEKILSDDDLFLIKINKKGIGKTLNYTRSRRSLELDGDLIAFVLKTGQDKEIPTLRADEFLRACFQDDKAFKITRTHLFDKDLKIL